jgi:hypothetical protein
MRKLIAALCRRLRRSHGSANSVGFLEGLPDPERDAAEKWTFTVGNMPLEETVVAGLTLSDERADDPEWIARFCRVYNIRFADEAGPRSSGEDSGY